MERFGTIVKRLRQEKGWTIDDVARRIRSHKGYISGIENGKVNPPSAKVVVSLAKYLGHDPEDLLLRAYVEKAPKLVRAEVKRRVFGIDNKSERLLERLARSRRQEAAPKLARAIQRVGEVFGMVYPEDLKGILASKGR